MAETVSTNQFRNGMHIQLDGSVWRILDFQHVKPGKGGAFVRSRLRNLDSGAVVDKTFRAGEKFPRIRTEVKEVQYLYDSGDDVVFMDTETYDQFSLPHATVEDALPYMEPPFSYMPMRHGLGAALLAAGRSKEAEQVYREDLKRFPNNGWSLFGLGQSLTAQGKSDAAEGVQRQFKQAWIRADVTITSSRF